MSGALLLASLVPLSVIGTIWLTLEGGIPHAYVAMHLEQQLLPGQVTLCSTQVQLQRPRIYRQLEELIHTEPGTKRDAMIRRVKVGPALLRDHSTWALFAIFTIQMMFFIFAVIADYRFL